MTLVIVLISIAVAKSISEYLTVYFQIDIEIMEYLEIYAMYCRDGIADKLRSRHLWVKVNGIWNLRQGLKDYFCFYNYERVHQNLKYKTPAEVFLSNHKIRYI